MSDYDDYDSDSDYNENEKILLEKYRKYESDDENEEGIFNVIEEDEEDSDDDHKANSDIEEEEDDLPNEKAWGRNKKAYYASDYVNCNTVNEKELQFAEFEAQEATKLEAEIWQQLNDFTVFKHGEKKDDEEDINEKEINLVKKEENTSLNLIRDFKEYTEIYKKFLEPFKEQSRTGQVESAQLLEFVESFSDLILNYSMNIFMFFLLKSEKISTQNHPIIGRLEQYQELTKKLHTVFEESIRSRVELLLKNEGSNILKSPEQKKKKLKLLQNLVLKPICNEKKTKKLKESKVRFSEENDNHEVTTEKEEQKNMETDELVKRPITYQMAKNKGLTPHRKKEQRNPRVKHRNKFKKAKIRRKGAVREVRNEGRRYGGEISGINANVLKGIKLKV